MTTQTSSEIAVLIEQIERLKTQVEEAREEEASAISQRRNLETSLLNKKNALAKALDAANVIGGDWTLRKS